MAYNPDYYKNKKDEVMKKFEGNKNQLITDMTSCMNRFYESQKDLQDRFNELTKQEEESQKMTEEESKKVIDEKVKAKK
jgi:pyruvate/2-oxoacid:ferredoxin oxidoreductase beta subunit